MAEEINSYIDAAKAASNRGRHVLLVLVTASIISFAAARNSRHEGWMNQRLELAKTAFMFCNTSSSDAQPKWDDANTLKMLPPQDAKLKEDLKSRAKWFYDLRYRSCRDLGIAVGELEKVNIENSDLIHVPFFGLSFDINDLGMLSSITFVVVLIWLRLSLETELRSVRLTFAKADSLSKANNTDGSSLSEFATAYELLGTCQVFTRIAMPVSLGPRPESSPPVRFKRVLSISFVLAGLALAMFLLWDISDYFRPFKLAWADLTILVDILIAVVAVRFLRLARPEVPIHFWQHLSFGLYWLPVIVLLAIFRDNLASIEYGLSISRSSTWWLLCMELLFLVATWLLTLDCMRIARETDQEWAFAAEKMKISIASSSSTQVEQAFSATAPMAEQKST